MLTGSCHCGAVHWTFEGYPETATACNCTVCRRLGTLWAYGWDGENITTSGDTKSYVRGDADADIGFHFCDNCGCNTWWKSIEPTDQGRVHIAVNLRLIEDPETIQHLPIRHFDGLDTFKDHIRDDRCVADHWY